MAPAIASSWADTKAHAQGDKALVREIEVTVSGQPARVFVGGWGAEHLLLIHGGWGGARTHWSSVWEDLAKHFNVIAPDLPGIGQTDQAPLDSVEAYAHWLYELLDALGAPSAWCVGNSFGASVACRFARDFPARCAGLVLVNGFPMPRSPKLLRRLGERPLGHRIVRFMERNIAYSPAALARGFADPSRAPEELRTLVRARSSPELDAMAKILVHGDSSAPSSFAPLLLWGEDDRLLGTSANAARRLHASLPGSKLVFVKGAGHLPQIENPAAFVHGLVGFVDSAAPTLRSPRADAQ